MVCCKLVQVCFTGSWEAEQPEDRLRDSLEDVQPGPHRGRLDLVELVEVAEHNCMLGEAILCACGEREVVQQRSSVLLTIIIVIDLMVGMGLRGGRR